MKLFALERISNSCFSWRNRDGIGWGFVGRVGCGFFFGNIEVVEPAVVFGNNNREWVVGVGDNHTAVVTVKIARIDGIFGLLPDKIIVEPVDIGERGG